MKLNTKLNTSLQYIIINSRIDSSLQLTRYIDHTDSESSHTLRRLQMVKVPPKKGEIIAKLNQAMDTARWVVIQDWL